MDLDTSVFFLIVVGGVVTVWSFKLASGRRADLKEIEYLTFASIWGTLLVIGYSEILKRVNQDLLTQLLSNPLASALVFGSIGLFVGFGLGYLVRKFRLDETTKKLINK